MKIILKISGEFLDRPELLDSLANNIRSVSKDCFVGIVVGGGNLVRGRDHAENRYDTDITGMYSTIVNGLRLRSVIPEAVIYNSFESGHLNKFNLKSIQEQISKKQNIAIFTGGIGIPYFSTDMCAIVRGIDISADLVLKCTKEDGVYDKDPKISGSKLLQRVTYRDILKNNLNVMDLTAAALAEEHKVQMVVFNGYKPENILKAIRGEIGTIVTF